MIRKACMFMLILLTPLAASAGVEMVFSLEPVYDYFAIPSPNDLHRYPDGRVDRSRYPIDESNLLVQNYRDYADGRDGFAVTETVFIRMSGALPGLSLPGPEDSVLADSPVFLVNIDPDSEGFGERVPVQSYFHNHRYGPLKNLLAIAPYPGFVLRENTVYAAVVMSSLHPSLSTSPMMALLLNGENPGGPLGERAREAYQPLAAFMKEQGISPDQVAAATVYTTGDPTRELRRIMDYIDGSQRFQLEGRLEPYRDHPSFYALKGSFLAPQFQTGKGSELLRGGKVVFDAMGRPVVQRMERVPVKVMVPKGRMPAKGFPLVIYLHGGSGNSDEFLDHIIKSKDNQFTPGEGPARTFAEQRIAGVSLGIVKNPERYGRLGANNRLAELPFYNFFRAEVITANHWQAVADSAAVLRLMRGLAIDPALCPETDASASFNGKIRFDADNFFGMGFSMGGTILTPWSAVDPGLKAIIPSGASGHWGLLMRNFTGVPAKSYLFAWLTQGRPDEEMDHRWPVISLLQAALEPCDTITYAPHVARRPFPGHPARHVYLAVGSNDYYTKAVTQNAIILALGLPLMGEVQDDSILPGERLLGHNEPLAYPVSANLVSDDGQKVTAAAVQYQPDFWTNEGHNVNYNLTETKHQYGCFLRTLVDTGMPVIPAPGPEGSPCGD